MTLTANATPNEVAAEIGYLQDKIRTTIAERNALPRNDKKAAHKMLADISSMQAEVKRLKTSLYKAEAHEQRRENHSMWVRSVSALFGEDAPRKCFDWMRQQRQEQHESRERMEKRAIKSPHQKEGGDL